MAKIVDSIKGFVHKNFTQEVTCSNCGQKGKIISFTTLKDGNKLCTSCKRSIPTQFDFNAKESTLEEFKELYDYMQYSKNKLEPIFEPDYELSYGNFEVDPVNNLCRINDGFVFEINNITSYNFEFKAEDVKEGLLSTKAKGTVYLTYLTLENPYAMFKAEIIKFGAKGKADKPLFSNTYIYENPEEMDAFLIRFNELVDKVQKEKKEKEFQNLVEQKARELIEQNAKENN